MRGGKLTLIALHILPRHDARELVFEVRGADREWTGVNGKAGTGGQGGADVHAEG